VTAAFYSFSQRRYIPEREYAVSMRVFHSGAALACASLIAAQPSAQQIRSISERSYIFAYPMVLMEYTRRASVERGTLGGPGAANQFTHAQQFPDDTFHQVIRPNADTLYSSSWIDLTKEPVLLHVPDTHDRYYLMQFMDAWTETFSVPGKRSTGTGEGWFAIVGPAWKGTLPERAQRIDAPTNMVWLIGRTQTNGASDYENVHAIQRGYRLMPLSQYPDGPRPSSKSFAPAPRETGTPPQKVQALPAETFFETFSVLLAANPPHAEDAPMMRELAKIGIEPGKPFRPETLGAEGMKALGEGAEAAAKRLALLDGRNGKAGPTGWTGGAGKVGRYGTDYAVRASVARIGLGANPPEDAVYMHCHQDSEGRPFDGAHRYRIHFAADQLPPVRAFWSVTMYSLEGYFVHNPINRFAIGDRDPLKKNTDGSLDLYIQHEGPGGDKDVNWLPSPTGDFNLSLRLYWPEDAILKGKWNPPAVTRE
jgi:hypothetical protein